MKAVLSGLAVASTSFHCEGSQGRRGQDRGRHGDRVCREHDDQGKREIGLRDRSRGGCPELVVDPLCIGQDVGQGLLRQLRGEVGRARKQLYQLAPADGAIVRIGSGLRQNRIQAIIETAPLHFASFKTGRNTVLVVRGPTEGG